MMLGDEGVDRPAHRLRHRHHIDEIAPRFGPGFAFGGIGSHRENLVWRLDASRPQRNPKHGRAPAEIVAVIFGLGAIELDLGGAPLKSCPLPLFPYRAPSRPLPPPRPPPP